MISESSRTRNPAGHAGLLQNLFALVSALAEFFESRFALLAQESKAAAVQVLILAGCLIFAVLLCAVGYVFLITGAVAGLAHLGGISWPWIALAAAALHFFKYEPVADSDSRERNPLVFQHLFQAEVGHERADHDR